MEDFVTVNPDGYEAEIERLRRDQNTLLMELPKIRQKQQDTEILLDAVKERIQRSERWQQQTMALLAMSLEEPDAEMETLIQQLVSANGGGNGSEPDAEMETLLLVIENVAGSSSMDPANEVGVESTELTGVEGEQGDQEEIEVPLEEEEGESGSWSPDVQDLVEEMGNLGFKA